jgi:hypothetical protein
MSSVKWDAFDLINLSRVTRNVQGLNALGIKGSMNEITHLQIVWFIKSFVYTITIGEYVRPSMTFLMISKLPKSTASIYIL